MCLKVHPVFFIFRLLPFHNTNINQQNHIHHQSIDNGRYRNDVIIENKRAAGNSNALGSILHADFNHQSAHLLTIEPHSLCQKRTSSHCRQNQHGHAQSQLPELLYNGFPMLDKKHGS